MELIGLGADFMPINPIRFTELQWYRRYYEPGQFVIRVIPQRTDDKISWDGNIKYIYRNDRPETGVIQKIEYSVGDKRQIELSGFFLEQMLNEKIIYPTYYASGNRELEIRRMVETYKADLPLVTLGPVNGIGSTATWQNTGGNMADVIYENLQTEGISFRTDLDYVNNKILFYCYQGKDKTYTTGQVSNNPVVFKPSLGSIRSLDYLEDISDYKNCAIVAGQGEGDARIFAVVDHSGGDRRREIFCDQKSESQEGTDAEYIEALKQIGEEKLLKYLKLSNLEIDVTQHNQVYGVDYDLGDICQAIIPEIDRQMTGRIIEVYEHYVGGNRTIEVTLGDKILSKYDKLKGRI